MVVHCREMLVCPLQELVVSKLGKQLHPVRFRGLRSLSCVSVTTQWRCKKFVPCAAPITKESLVVAVSEGRGAGDVAKKDRRNRTHGAKGSWHAHQSRKKCVPCVAPITKESLVVVVSEGRGAGDVAKMDRQNHTHGTKDLSHAHQTIQPPQLVSMFHYNEGVADKYIPVNARRMLV